MALDNDNSPYAMITYDEWDIEIPGIYPNLTVVMTYWGYITSNGTGSVIINGEYILNPRVTLIIYLTINA